MWSFIEIPSISTDVSHLMKQALIDNERTPGKHIAFAEDSLAEAKLIRYITGD